MFSTLLTFLGLVNVTRLRGQVDHCTSVSVFSPEWLAFKDTIDLFNDLSIRYSLYGESVISWYNDCSLGESVHFAIDPSSNVSLLRTNLITSMWYPVEDGWKKYGRTVHFVALPFECTEQRWNGLMFNVPKDYLSMV